MTDIGSSARIDRDGTSPIWLQLLRIIETGIDNGVWAVDDRLPSEHELCRHYGVSRTSVREALARLEAARLIRREQGRGAFVEARPECVDWTLQATPALLGERIRDGRSPLRSRVVRAGREPLPSWAAAIVGDDDGTGFVVERIRSVGNVAAVHVVNHLPARLAGLAPSLRDPRASLYAALEQVAGLRISRMRRTIEAVSADRALARILEVEVGHPTVVIEAVAYDQRDRPVDVSRTTVRTERLRISVDSSYDLLGAEPDIRARSLHAIGA